MDPKVNGFLSFLQTELPASPVYECKIKTRCVLQDKTLSLKKKKKKWKRQELDVWLQSTPLPACTAEGEGGKHSLGDIFPDGGGV